MRNIGRQTERLLALSSIMLLVLLTGAIWSPRAATAATYYVATTGNDANPGTQAQPFRTIQKGLAVVRAGDTLYLRGGTYDGFNAQNQTIPSGTSWENPITFAGYPGESVVLIAGINLYVPTGLLQYVIFDNFILDGVPYSALGAGLQHIRFQNSEVKNNVGGSGVGGGFQARYLEYINLHVHHNGTDRLDHGFYVCAKNIIIRDCDIHDNAGYGLQFFDSGNLHCGDDSAIYNRHYRK